MACESSNHLKKTTYILTFLAVCLLTMVGLANDPNDDLIKAEKGLEKVEGSVEAEKMEETSGSNLPVEASDQPVATENPQIAEGKMETINSVGKFNYLFYFIYKHTYQDKMLIEQDLVDKL